MASRLGYPLMGARIPTSTSVMSAWERFTPRSTTNRRKLGIGWKCSQYAFVRRPGLRSTPGYFARRFPRRSAADDVHVPRRELDVLFLARSHYVRCLCGAKPTSEALMPLRFFLLLDATSDPPCWCLALHPRERGIAKAEDAT